MANEEQLAILKLGVDAWNKWRKENSWVAIDLSRADRSEARVLWEKSKRAVEIAIEEDEERAKEIIRWFSKTEEHVIDLLCRVCTVSVETMKIVNQMPK